ncbi:ribosome biogenesis GTPase Der [Catalinimonas niigatensis]|uniref:ribosome biogenesis GTPase Der n=1 Tax=Catalinimonas niigatensis TaxID=1397264 RepID=UPI00266582EC|nr:ribosome biogenesis GTPase Der [Catalinimonas niigatensis]WPP52727.1 ribosome biogenesis GTPase Der [Catalinimonas niigatensis]
MSNIVAIVGRPNVGKSTLFNRLIEERKAIMDDVSGVTRDRHYGYGQWNGLHYTVIDTGGYVANSDDIFEEAIRTQVQLALTEATVILFMVDCETGITDLDESFAQVLRGTKKPIYIVANKADNHERSFMASEFYAIGLGEVFPVSSVSGSGTGDLLDAVVSHFPADDEENPEAGIPRLAILGRPNVGKSSFLNVLLGEERSIVTDIAGTTRDALHSRYNLYGKDFILIDTAGLRKKAKISDNVEFYSTIRSIQALEDSDICIVMLDAERGMEAQDMNIVQLADKHRKGILILVNKWDLIEKDTHTALAYKKNIEERLGEFNYIPIIFTSVVNKQRVFQAVEKATEIYENRQRRISTSKLNEILGKDIEHYPPPSVKGKHIKIKYITQLPTHTPSFAFFCNHPKHIKMAYRRYLENKIRSHFNFEGVPLNIFFRQK